MFISTISLIYGLFNIVNRTVLMKSEFYLKKDGSNKKIIEALDHANS